MKPTWLSSKGTGSLRLQSVSCDSPSILYNAYLALISSVFIFSLQLCDLLSRKNSLVLWVSSILPT